MQVGTGGGRGGAEKELAEETQSPSQPEYLQMVDNRADRIKPLSVRFSSP